MFRKVWRGFLRLRPIAQVILALAAMVNGIVWFIAYHTIVLAVIGTALAVVGGLWNPGDAYPVVAGLLTFSAIMTLGAVLRLSKVVALPPSAKGADSTKDALPRRVHSEITKGKLAEAFDDLSAVLNSQGKETVLSVQEFVANWRRELDQFRREQIFIPQPTNYQLLEDGLSAIHQRFGGFYQLLHGKNGLFEKHHSYSPEMESTIDKLTDEWQRQFNNSLMDVGKAMVAMKSASETANGDLMMKVLVLTDPPISKLEYDGGVLRAIIAHGIERIRTAQTELASS